MDILKNIAEQIGTPKPLASVYLLGSEDSDKPFSIALPLATEGGCLTYIPQISSSEITNAVIQLAKKGYSSFALCWVPCIEDIESAAAMTGGRDVRYNYLLAISNAEYFYKRANKMPSYVLRSGVFGHYDGCNFIRNTIL